VCCLPVDTWRDVITAGRVEFRASLRIFPQGNIVLTLVPAISPPPRHRMATGQLNAGVSNSLINAANFHPDARASMFAKKKEERSHEAPY